MDSANNITNFRSDFKNYYNPLVNYVRSIIVDEMVAEDLVQDVFTQYWDYMNDNSILNPKAFLFKSAYNRSIEYVRRERKRKSIEAEAKLTPGRDEDEHWNKIAYEYLLKEKLSNSLRQLPPKCREVFLMSKVNGLTYSEIAKELKISHKTVENQMHIALKKLRILLKDALRIEE